MEPDGNPFVRIDSDRRRRCGFPEFVFGAGKTPEQLTAIVTAIAASGEPVLVTRLSQEVYAVIKEGLPGFTYDPLARCLYKPGANQPPPEGKVLILTAGTSDLPAAYEAKLTAELCGCGVECAFDVGVAGIHRLFAQMDKLDAADVIIAVAGMEGALPSVVAGLVSCPVIAVPTSAGYGASFGGVTALLAMLNSCGNGVVVMNIDNGFGAGCAAARIANTLKRKRHH